MRRQSDVWKRARGVSGIPGSSPPSCGGRRLTKRARRHSWHRLPELHGLRRGTVPTKDVTLGQMDAERRRLAEAREKRVPWWRWGTFLSERQWGTVREDYSAGGDAWNFFPHNHARSRAYRWGEDGLLGICDSRCRLCFSIALWNETDPILKERLFGLGGPEGNHGEDVKEAYFYLDCTPSHAYMRGLSKFPQRAL